MDEDSNEGPLNVWKMFNAPTLYLFNNLEVAIDGLERLLTSILKLSGESSEVLVSRAGTSKYPDSYYCSFSTWILGRLFYICSVKELAGIHMLSQEAQLKILNILCMNQASFHDKLQSEYYSILAKLIQYYRDKYDNDQLPELILENFASEQIDAPDVGLNFEPIFVHVKDISMCKALIEVTLHLLSETIPHQQLFLDETKSIELESTLSLTINVLENYSVDLKLVVVNFFLNLIKNSNDVAIAKFNDQFPNIYQDFLCCLHAMVSSEDVFYEQSEIDHRTITAFNTMLLKFLKAEEETLYKEFNDILLGIAITIVTERPKKVFNKKLKLYCLSLSKYVKFPKDILKIENRETEEIKMLVKCYSNELLSYIESQNSNKNKVDLTENWYYEQIISVISKTMITCQEEMKMDNFLVTHHLRKIMITLSILHYVDTHNKRIIQNDFYKHTISLLNNTTLLSLWDFLKNLNKYNYKGIVENEECLKIFLDITFSTGCLNEDTIRSNTAVLWDIFCPSHQFFTQPSSKESTLVKLTIMKYAMATRVVLNSIISESWATLIVSIMNAFTNKALLYEEMVLLCPFLLLINVFSSNKIIEEILFSAFMTKNEEVQGAILKVLPAITCVCLGTSCIVLTSAKESLGHRVFTNGIVNISVLCAMCHNNDKSTTTSLQYIKRIKKEYRVLCIINHPQDQQTGRTGLCKLLTKFLNFTQYANIEESNYWDLFGWLCNHYSVFDFGITPAILDELNIQYALKAMKSYFIDPNKMDEGNLGCNSTQKEEVLFKCITCLLSLTKSSLDKCDYNKQTHAMNTIKILGMYRNEKVILPVTKLFVYFIMSPYCAVAPKAVVYLRDVCEAQGFTPNQVYHRYKKDYCKLFVECSLYNGKDFAISLLKVVRAFGFVGYRDFISKDVHHFLPYLIPYSLTIKEVPLMIEEIASLVQCPVTDFLIDRFPQIYVHLYLNESDEVTSKSFDMIEKCTRMSILLLIKRHFRVILTEFLLQYCCNPAKVLRACRYLASNDPDSPSPISNISMSTSQIAEFLNPKFLGVLAYFDRKLINAKVALSVKRKALKSFPDIMQLMGVRYLTPLRYKILATLRSALPLAQEFPKVLADAWGSFIHNIDTMTLGPILPSLAVSLLHQFDYAPQEINQNFQYLILNHENLLSAYIPNLFFVLNSKITNNVKLVIKKHVRRTQPEGFLEKIKWYLQHLDQEIPSMKACAFSNLDELLKSNRAEIHKAIFGGKNIDPVIVELIDALLIGCKDSEASVNMASAACFGQLGAIEASHLPRQYVQTDSSPFAFSIREDCFAATALLELSRAFQYEKNTANMDCYALTIQEILKVYEISPNGAKKEVWSNFPDNIHQILHPLLSSRYTLAYSCQPKKVHPLFGSTYATTFFEWAHNWIAQLIPLIEVDIRELLCTVLPSMRRDSRLLYLFMPYVLLHAIISENDTQHIKEEILAVIGLESLDNEGEVIERSKYKMLRHTRLTPNINSIQTEEGNQNKCRKTIYTLFDFLNKWLLESCHLKTRPLENENYKSVVRFLNGFDKLMIARGNIACGELERALQYLELYMGDNKDRIQEQLPLLAEIYALLDEPDAVAGILSIKRSEPSLKELILGQVVTGRLEDAALCYERLAQEGQLDKHSLRGMVDCYLGLDQPFTAYRLLCEHGEEDSTELTAEPLWRLGRFEQLDELVKKPVPASRETWGLVMGRVLLAYRAQQVSQFEAACAAARTRLLSCMHEAGRGESALRSSYQNLLGLHIVTEAHHAEGVLAKLKKLRDGDMQGMDLINQLLNEWRLRLAVVQSDVRTIEPLLRTRRILLQQSKELLEPTHPVISNKIKKSIGDLWLQSAKHARKAGIVQQSYMYCLNAEEYQPEELFIEKAKMYWARGQNEHAFTTLKRGLDEAYPQIQRLTQEQRKICAKAKLLIAKYNDETTSVDVDVNIGYYKEAVEVFGQWEKSLVCLGAYYEKICTNDGQSSSSDTKVWSWKIQALNSYGKALQYGHKYLYQSMPRMLSIWLDVQISPSNTSEHAVLAQMTEKIKIYSEKLPIHLYLTAFSQIVSRICHPVKEVFLQLKAIIVKLILAYPQHTMWMMMCVIKSSYKQRRNRCMEVFADPRLKEPRMLKLFCDFTQLAENLIELCNFPIKSDSPTVTSLVRSLPRLLAGNNFSHIMMPYQEFCKIVLPSKGARQERLSCHIHAEPKVYIASIKEQITILPSLQKPRKVTLIGSDGKAYIVLLKPRDDLRKDFRLMEFNGVVNRFLQDAPETRRRRLYIRTYSVLPLNEECGIIEWVPNLVGFRPILCHIYKQKGIHTNNRELKEMMCNSTDPIEKKRRIFEEQLLPRHPPVFQEWFRRVFSDPYGWYQARSAYIRTTAVMSMIGFILGLGDRHGENISFDSTNGDTVHVDFNCLFNKGESFGFPERVPFRLTHNMEAAMGPLKHEGMFRKSCEAVMRALRAQTAALMSVVGPFVYDPLLAWGARAPDRAERAERTNEHALHQISMIRQRLNGMVKTKNKELSVSLSSEGQVQHLIVEATSIHNLCQMYIGWGPYL